MAPRKKPDATDTEPPEEARPDTTGTPLSTRRRRKFFITGCEIHSGNVLRFIVKCIAESGGRYRLPVSNVSVIEKQAE